MREYIVEFLSPAYKSFCNGETCICRYRKPSAKYSEATLLEKSKFVVASGAEFLRQPNYDKKLNWPTDFECVFMIT